MYACLQGGFTQTALFDCVKPAFKEHLPLVAAKLQLLATLYTKRLTLFALSHLRQLHLHGTLKEFVNEQVRDRNTVHLVLTTAPNVL